MSGTTDGSVTLSWTEVDDGTGAPASYEIRYALMSFDDGWGDATTVVEGDCAVPAEGSEVGATISCTVGGLDPATSYDFQLVAFREHPNGTKVYSEDLSNISTGETDASSPGTVEDLSPAASTTASVTLEWTGVDDGTGTAALYEVRYSLASERHEWGGAVTVTEGTCAMPVDGHGVDAAEMCAVEDLDPGTGYDFQLVAFRTEDDGSRVYGEELSNVATATTEEAPAGNPSNVTDLSASGTTDSTVTVSWTEVGDGMGAPVSYEIRYALAPIGSGWGDASIVVEGDCASPVTGREVGATISCTVGGLDPSTKLDFQLVAFREEDDGGRVYSQELSNVATATTEEAATTEEEPQDGNSPEPESFSVLAETSYASANEGAFHSSKNENFDIVDDAGAPRSSSKVARATFPAGLGDGVSPVWSEAAISSHSARRVYVSFWIKISDNWQGHSTGVNKVAIIWTHEKPVVVANILGTDDGRLGSDMRIQDVPDGARNLAPNLADPEIVRGRWHRWEVLLVSNVDDAEDGEVHWWVDGTKVGAYADVRFGGASQSKVWDYVTWRPVWGGRGDVIEETQHMWMDHYYVSGAQ